MASKINKLETHHLKDLKSLLKHDKRDTPAVLFKTPTRLGQFILEAISYESMSPASEGGARAAYLIYRIHGYKIHPLFWNARKLRRFSQRSSTA